MNDLVVYCADIGSVKAKRFGWARLCREEIESERRDRGSILDLVAAVVEDLQRGNRVALGFECPLFIPLPGDPNDLTAARRGEFDRPWSAGAGAACLTTGLTETVWILERIRAALVQAPSAHLEWKTFQEAATGLFLWEAFVTKTAKRNSHQSDAEAAVKHFDSLLPDIDESNAISSTRVRSLIGAAILQAGWSTDLSLLGSPCIVLRIDTPISALVVPGEHADVAP